MWCLSPSSFSFSSTCGFTALYPPVTALSLEPWEVYLCCLTRRSGEHRLFLAPSFQQEL